MLYIKHDATNSMSINLDKDRGSGTQYSIRIWNDVEGSVDNNTVSYSFTPIKLARKAIFNLVEPTNVDLKGVKGSFSYLITNSVGSIVDRGKIRAYSGNLPSASIENNNSNVTTHLNASKIYGFGDNNYIAPDDTVTNTQYLNI
tara:strand:- start:24459 stop:24890 length:432 start_codon:yes stop_codon:yes gene_type:complete